MDDEKSLRQQADAMESEHQQQNQVVSMILRREYVCGQTRDTVKEKWGPIFDERIWNDIEQAAHARTQERSAEPHMRDSLKREYDHPHPHDEALEKWGTEIEAMIMERMHMDDVNEANARSKCGPDVDRD